MLATMGQFARRAGRSMRRVARTGRGQGVRSIPNCRVRIPFAAWAMAALYRLDWLAVDPGKSRQPRVAIIHRRALLPWRLFSKIRVWVLDPPHPARRNMGLLDEDAECRALVLREYQEKIARVWWKPGT